MYGNLFANNGIRHVPVIYGKQLVGIISKTDLNRLTFSSLFAGQDDADEAVFDMLTISQVMSHKPRVVKANETIKQVAEILLPKSFMLCP
jgi:CBS domain-containing protein